jgi:hypothetical protein
MKPRTESRGERVTGSVEKLCAKQREKVLDCPRTLKRRQCANSCPEHSSLSGGQAAGRLPDTQSSSQDKKERCDEGCTD